MSENSPIEWTDHTFNPWWGCAKVSPACDFCYAERDAHRYQPQANYWGVDAPRRSFGEAHWNAPLKWERKAFEAGKPARVFCASMADVFDKNAPQFARPKLWDLIRRTPNLRWLLLTKRIGNAPSMLPDDWDRGYPNVWVGISVVTQKEADRDVPKLLELPAAVRFLSCEPLLEAVDLYRAAASASWVAVAFLEAAAKKREAEFEQRIQYRTERYTKELTELRGRVARFETESGLKLDDWRLGNVAALAKAIDELSTLGGKTWDKVANTLEHQEQVLGNLIECVRLARAAIK